MCHKCPKVGIDCVVDMKTTVSPFSITTCKQKYAGFKVVSSTPLMSLVLNDHQVVLGIARYLVVWDKHSYKSFYEIEVLHTMKVGGTSTTNSKPITVKSDVSNESLGNTFAEWSQTLKVPLEHKVLSNDLDTCAALKVLLEWVHIVHASNSTILLLYACIDNALTDED